MANYVTLNDYISGRTELTEVHLDSFKELIGKGLRSQERKDAVARLTLSILSLKKPYGIYDRVHFYPNGACTYVSGQDYTAEMATLKDLFFSNR